MKYFIAWMLCLLPVLTACDVEKATAPLTTTLGYRVYVEPELLQTQTNTVSVIVTATSKNNSQTDFSLSNLISQLGGQVTSDLWLINAAVATIPTAQLPTLSNQPGILSIVENKQVKTTQGPGTGWVTEYDIPVPWDGRADVQATADPAIWNLVNPVTIDIGADQLHNNQNITGQGVTVAVLDSGVYFADKTKSATQSHIATIFKGQVDFVDSGLCSNGHFPVGPGVEQQAGYCFTDYQHSYDGYGHGSHVAGTIWNNFTDANTGVRLGIAPNTSILSVRVLNDDGYGTYADVIEGIQYIVANKDLFDIKIVNISLGAHVTAPYFIDPLNRAVEQAWATGIVVVASAGNFGPASESIDVPGNDPYVITVGSIDSNRTPGYWPDDLLPTWSATGPTLDGFAKPDLLAPGANIVSFVHTDPLNNLNSAKLGQAHPTYAGSETLFRMNGTSMSTAVVSGVAALILQANPNLTPDQVKFRLMQTARPAMHKDGSDLVYNLLQQGRGRIWAPDAVLQEFPPDQHANASLDIHADLAHGIGWTDANGDGLLQIEELDPAQMAFHYQGNIRRTLSNDGATYLYFMVEQ